MLARIAVARSPLSITTILPDTMSVATARKGIGSWSKSDAGRALRHKAAQQVLDAAGIDQAARHDDAAVLDAQFQRVAVGDPGALLLDGFQVAPAQAADHGIPVDAEQELLISAPEMPDA